AGNVATLPSFPIWAERGRTDVTAQSQRKVPLIYLGDYEADTRIFDATAVVSGGAAIASLLQPLNVASISIDGQILVGLVGAQLGDGEPIVGRVTKLPTQNGGKLRYIRAYA